jgi:hypothetical protein
MIQELLFPEAASVVESASGAIACVVGRLDEPGQAARNMVCEIIKDAVNPRHRTFGAAGRCTQAARL